MHSNIKTGDAVEINGKLERVNRTTQRYFTAGGYRFRKADGELIKRGKPGKLRTNSETIVALVPSRRGPSLREVLDDLGYDVSETMFPGKLSLYKGGTLRFCAGNHDVWAWLRATDQIEEGD